MNDKYGASSFHPWVSALEKQRGDLLEQVRTLVDEAVCAYANGRLSSSTRKLRKLQSILDAKLPRKGTKK